MFSSTACGTTLSHSAPLWPEPHVVLRKVLLILGWQVLVQTELNLHAHGEDACHGSDCRPLLQTDRAHNPYPALFSGPDEGSPSTTPQYL